jgi:hypothetical protein
MPRKPKFEEERPTKPGHGRTDAVRPTARASLAAANRKASEAPTEPPPAPEDEVRVSIPIPKATVKVSGVRPKRRGAPAATIDEVTADMTKDPRRDDDD